MKKTLGGDRLGSGNRMKVELHNYERSTHDLGFLWRSTMSSGTLVPFLSKVALPGDTFDIDLDCDVKTHPTVGPLFGSFKIQLDIFQAPLRLYQGKLHNNKLGIGLNMSQIKLPILQFDVTPIATADIVAQQADINTAQINPSCILAYLGLRGFGMSNTAAPTNLRNFNGVPLLAYWDIYKNYYSNKQEEIGAVIHNNALNTINNVTSIENENGAVVASAPALSNVVFQQGSTVEINLGGVQDYNQVILNTSRGQKTLAQLLGGIIVDNPGVQQIYQYDYYNNGYLEVTNWQYVTVQLPYTSAIQVQTFNLSEIDDMREAILSEANLPNPFDIFAQGLQPYNKLLEQGTATVSIMGSQEGLAIKTYQSDVFNNWIQTDWIDGVNGINQVTAIDTSGGSFTLDTLNLSKKVYDMLNRIAVSGGTYDDWLDAVYTHDRYTRCETPMYMGGLIKELVFQEVVSNAEASTDGQVAQPLGTLAGKGIMGNKHKGGKVTIKVDEPSYIIGIISLTPRIDYSQGNNWDVHLETMDDLHKPALDEIGFQELITEQIAWWDTFQAATGTWTTRSAGKQPAWINYMTDVNRCYGNFAIPDNEMFMTLNRRYTAAPTGAEEYQIQDLTTYIHPEKYNQIFAQTSLDSQNFWTQISVDIKARRKLSAKLMPNL